MKLTKKLKSNKGFTLVELVVVIAVLAILAGVGSVAYSGYITRAKEAADMSTLAAVQTAAVAACAEKGVVTNIIIADKDGNAITATVKIDESTTKTYNLVGDTSSNKNDAAVKANFSTFIGSNDVKLTSDKYASGATWDYTSNSWATKTA